MSLLRLKGIAKAYGPRLLFRHVELSVNGGEVSLLAGANGAGKSTLMRIMAGLSRPDAGEVECEVAENEPAKLGYLGHATFLYPGMTARENLLFWGRANGLVDVEIKADAALESVGLARHAHDRTGNFSRGMAQRLNLARLLQAEPKLWLLDEPGTGLDTSARELLRAEVSKAKARGAGIVWISHDVDDDARFADRVVRLEGRTLHEVWTPHGERTQESRS